MTRISDNGSTGNKANRLSSINPSAKNSSSSSPSSSSSSSSPPLSSLSRISKIFSLVLIMIQHVNKLKVSKTQSRAKSSFLNSIKTLFLELASLSKWCGFPCFAVTFIKFCKASFLQNTFRSLNLENVSLNLRRDLNLRRIMIVKKLTWSFQSIQSQISFILLIAIRKRKKLNLVALVRFIILCFVFNKKTGNWWYSF